jgi:hypothetical protein
MITTGRKRWYMHNARTSRTAAAILSITLTIMGAAVFAAFRDTAPWRAPTAAHAADPPGNDNFNRGTDISPTEFVDALPFDGSQSTAGATLEDGERAPCAAAGATVWYAYRPDQPGTIAITTAGSDFDTVLTVYTATGFVPSPPGQNLVSAGCDDNSGGGQTSALTLAVTPSEQYFIQVGGKAGATGQLQLHAACSPACKPNNDDLAMSRYTYLDAYRPAVQYHTDTTAATLEPGEPRACGEAGATVWYSFYAQSNMTLALDTTGSDFDTTLAVFAYRDVSISPPGGLTPLACDDNGEGTTSKLSVHLDGNQTFWIQAGGAGGAHGRLLLNMACKPGCPPYNDNRESANGMSEALYEQVSTLGATTQEGEPQPCGGIGRTIWYDLSMQGDTTVSLDTAGSDFDTVIAVYETTVEWSPAFGDLHELKCVDNAGGAQARVTFAAKALKRYLVQVGGHDGAAGMLQLAAACVPESCPPWGDSAAQPGGLYVWDNQPYEAWADTRGATTEPGEPLDCGAMGRTVWYTLYAQMDARVVLNTAQSDFDTAIAVYDAPPTSPPGAAATWLACDAPGGGGRARMAVPLKANTQVWVQIGGVHGAGGQLQVHVTCDPLCPPANDNSASAEDVSSSGDQRSADTRGATLEAGEAQPCGDIGATVWYRFTTGAHGGTLAIDASSNDFRPATALYRMDGMSPPGALTQVACGDAGSLTAELAANMVYYVQAGGAGGATGTLNVRFECRSAGCAADWEDGPLPATDGAGYGGGMINGPDTGSGGYLPGSRRAP